MLDTIPDKEEIIALVGKSLYEYGISYVLLLTRNMIWIACGIKAEKHGSMHTNIVGVERHCVHYMQEKIV